MITSDYGGFTDKIRAAQSGDRESLDALVRENLALVKFIVRRFQGRGKEFDDLYQVGCIGLVKAIQKFDTELGVQFSTYAVPMIMGEIRRFLRDDNTVHISRSVHDAAAKIGAYRRSFELIHSRAPTVEELCSGTMIDRELVMLALSATYPSRSLSEPVGDSDNLVLGDTIPVDGMQGVDDKLLLQDLMRRLQPAESAIIRARYFERRTQQDVGRELGFTQVQISRMESRILRKMRTFCDENAT